MESFRSAAALAVSVLMTAPIFLGSSVSCVIPARPVFSISCRRGRQTFRTAPFPARFFRTIFHRRDLVRHIQENSLAVAHRAIRTANLDAQIGKRLGGLRIGIVRADHVLDSFLMPSW